MPDRNKDRTFAAAALLAPVALVVLITLPSTADAQGGRIVCWKDKSGKVVGCGDKVPPEFLGNATREMDTRGVTRKTTESAEEAARRREREQETTKVRVEEDRRTLEQKRQDMALLETYANEGEIDLKRDRDLQVMDLQLEQLAGALKNMTARHNEVKSRTDKVEKSGKPLSPALKDELERAAKDKARYEASLQFKQKEKEELRVRYAEYRKRFGELRAQGGGASQSAARR